MSLQSVNTGKRLLTNVALHTRSVWVVDLEVSLDTVRTVERLVAD